MVPLSCYSAVPKRSQAGAEAAGGVREVSLRIVASPAVDSESHLASTPQHPQFAVRRSYLSLQLSVT